MTANPTRNQQVTVASNALDHGDSGFSERSLVTSATPTCWSRRGGVRVLLQRAIIGTTMAVAAWAIALLFRVLPAEVSDTMGLVGSALIGAVLGAVRLTVIVTFLLICASAVLLLVALTPMSETIAAKWVRNDSLDGARIDAVVALSADLNPDSTISGEALDHLVQASEIVRARRARALVTTTTAGIFPGGEIWSLDDQQRLVQLLGVQDSWLRTALSRSTHDEAVNAAALLLPLGLRRIAVVASPMHTRRACATFERAGFTVICLVSRNRDPDYQVRSPEVRDRITTFGAWVYELAAMVKYTMLGWLPSTS